MGMANSSTRRVGAAGRVGCGFGYDAGTVIAKAGPRGRRSCPTKAFTARIRGGLRGGERNRVFWRPRRLRSFLSSDILRRCPSAHEPVARMPPTNTTIGDWRKSLVSDLRLGGEGQDPGLARASVVIARTELRRSGILNPKIPLGIFGTPPGPVEISTRTPGCVVGLKLRN